MAKKLSPGEFPSITDWIKQFVGDGDVEPERKNYKIEIVQPENGTIGCNYAIAHAADPIVCTFTPNDGYQVVGFYVNGEESKLEFSMPAKDITITGKTEWIIYGTLEAPEISITYKDTTQIIYSVKNPNDAEVKFNGETINPGSALELTHIWGSSEESFLIDGYLEAEHWINSPEVSEIVYKYSQGLSFTAYSDYASLTGIGTCTDTDITVQPTYNGVPVTNLGNRAFSDNTTITSLKSESITSLRDYCFQNCSSLTSIDLPLVTSLGNSCFNSCTSLASIDIPNVTTLGYYYPFYNCSSLTSIDLPLVTSLGYFCFRNCSKLTSVNIPLVTSLGNNCFDGCSSLTSIDIPLITSLGDSCFSSCKSLTSVNIPLVTSLGNSCFDGCSSLTSIDIPLVTSLGSSCFSSCKSLTSIDLPNVTSLGDYCFNYCRFVDGITIPASVTSISRPFEYAKGFDVYCYMTSTTTKATTANQGWFNSYMYSSPTLHMLKTFDETTARETFGEYYDSHEISNKPIVVFDLDPQE